MNTPTATTAAENHRSIFLTKIRTPAGKAAARLLIESIQTFGGEMSGCPIWVFTTDPQNERCRDLASAQVQVIPLTVPPAIAAYPFGDKVLACAHAEAIAPGNVQSLIWLDLECLVVQPPLLFDLGNEFDAALRPVHIRNVGLGPADPLDAFWRGIYAAVGVEDVDFTVETFVDRQPLRAYFNSHGLAARPGLGLFQRWYQLFERLVDDDQFQAAACQDERHQIFLFQALWSALVVSSVRPQRVRILPPSYNYPYNLHGQVPPDRRAAALSDLVCFTFEGRTMHPDAVTDVEIGEPLRSWLQSEATVLPKSTS